MGDLDADGLRAAQEHVLDLLANIPVLCAMAGDVAPTPPGPEVQPLAIDDPGNVVRCMGNMLVLDAVRLRALGTPAP